MKPTPCRILIVDDDPDTLTNLSDILTDQGYDIEIAKDAKSALKKIIGDDTDAPNAHAPFDLCLLDFNLPDMNGAKLHQLIRDHDRNLRSILITAYRSVEETAHVHAVGAWHVLQKPVDIRVLLELIRRRND